MSTWSIYIVRCDDESLYTGISTDVSARIAAHNAGRGAAYTRSRGPVVLVWTQKMKSESEARKKEAAIKKLSRAEKEEFLRSHGAAKRPVPHVSETANATVPMVQKQVSEIFLAYLRRNGIKISNDFVVLKFSEEVGEFVQSYLIHSKRCRKAKIVPSDHSKKELAKELSDVVCLAFIIAQQLDVDLNEAIHKKWITREWIRDGMGAERQRAERSAELLRLAKKKK